MEGREGGGSPQQHITQQICRVEDFVKGADALVDVKVNVFYTLNVCMLVDDDNSTSRTRISSD